LPEVNDKIARNERIHELRETGMTQQAIADEVGIEQQTVSDVLTGKQSNTIKPVAPRKNTRQFYMPIKPETAAVKIREKFGDEFADLLAMRLCATH
jgi:transcriptional regulator with XRE-family HTH domain